MVKLSQSETGEGLSRIEDGTSTNGITNQIDYIQLSKNLGLHNNAISMMQGGNQMMRNQEATRRLMQQLNLSKKARGAVHVDDDISQSSEKFRKAYKVLPQGTVLKPVATSARLTPGGASQAGENQERKQIQQAMELCMVVDKEKSGKVQLQNFTRISQMLGLHVDNIELMRHMNERKNELDYVKLTQALLNKIN